MKVNHTQRFDALDTLRGFAALIVAVFHFKPSWAGYLAVDFFLVLSGFVLSHSYLYKNESINLTQFISHRFSRLYPLHLLTLFAFIATFYFLRGELPNYKDGTLFTFAQNLTLTQNIGFNPSEITYNFPSWSISVEFWINILFALFITQKTKSAPLSFIALCGLLIMYGNTGHLDTHSSNYFTFVNSA